MKVLNCYLKTAQPLHKPDEFTSFTPRENPICEMLTGAVDHQRFPLEKFQFADIAEKLLSHNSYQDE